MLEVAFTGAIGRDPELKTSASGKSYCSAPVAIGKGATVHIEGRLNIGTYTGKDGKERVSLDVAVPHDDLNDPIGF
jgi:single-stranded DNA-binding protein